MAAATDDQGLENAAILLMSLIIPWGVFTRYVLNSAASWPEPIAVLLVVTVPPRMSSVPA